MPDATDTTTPAKVDPTKGHSVGPFFVVKDTVITTDCDEHGDPDCPVDKRAWIGEFYGSERAAADAAFAARAMGSHDDLIRELEKAAGIILNALQIMTQEQKNEWARRNANANCDGEGTTRANERREVLCRARGDA